MIRPGFLDRESRQDLIELARNGSAAHRLARRANALVLLDDGMSCEAIAKVLLLDDDTIRAWYRLYEEDGIEGLTNFSYEGSACQLSGEQQEKLKTWVAAALPRTTRQVGAWIENEFGVVYEGRSGLIALLHRQGLEYHKPNVIPRKLDEEKQKAFIEGYEKLLNSLGDDEAVLFADAVHPTHAARPAGCWAPKQEKLAIEQTSGRQRINIHGAIDLQTGQTRMIEALTSTLPRRSSCCNRSRRSIRCWRSSMCSWTTRVIIMPSSCRNGWPNRDDASSCTSSQRIART
jgi:transposase